MSLKDLRETLLASIATRLSPFGYRRRGQDFHKEQGPARLSLHIAFIPHPGIDFDLTADVAVRHHPIEETLNRTRTDLSAKALEDTATVGAELGNLAGVGQHRWTIATPDDVEPAADGITSMFHSVGEPFLSRFISPSETYAALRTDDRLARLICPIPAQRERVLTALQSYLHERAV